MKLSWTLSYALEGAAISSSPVTEAVELWAKNKKSKTGILKLSIDIRMLYMYKLCGASYINATPLKPSWAEP